MRIGRTKVTWVPLISAQVDTNSMSLFPILIRKLGSSFSIDVLLDDEACDRRDCEICERLHRKNSVLNDLLLGSVAKNVWILVVPHQ